MASVKMSYMKAIFFGAVSLLSQQAYSDSPTPPTPDFSYCGNESNVNYFCNNENTVMRFSVSAADISNNSKSDSGIFRKAGSIRNDRDMWVAKSDTSGPLLTLLWPAEVIVYFHVHGEWFSSLHGFSWSTFNPADTAFTLQVTANNGSTVLTQRNIRFSDFKCFDTSMCVTAKTAAEDAEKNGIYDQEIFSFSQKLRDGYSNVEFKIVGFAPDVSVAVEKVDITVIKL